MAVFEGMRLGPYEIGGAHRRGWMGEAFRAKDTKFHRDVAIKMLPERFANDRGSACTIDELRRPAGKEVDPIRSRGR